MRALNGRTIVGIIAAGGEGVGARVAGPQLGARRLLEHRQPAPVIGVRLRVQEHFDVLDVEAELRDARHDHLRGGGIAGVEHDVALGPGDEEGGDIVRADVVEVAGDAERFGGRLPADFRSRSATCRRDTSARTIEQSQHDQPTTPGEAWITLLALLVILPERQFTLSPLRPVVRRPRAGRQATRCHSDGTRCRSCARSASSPRPCGTPAR